MARSYRNFVCWLAAFAGALVASSFAGEPSTTPATIPATQPILRSPEHGKPPAGGPAAIITLAGQVDDYNRDALFRRFERARKLGAKTVILQIDTYGGLVTSGSEISRFLKRQDDLYVIAFVRDKALSAGAMLAMACDEIVMGPSSTLGDCAPIVFNDAGRLEALPPAERAKQESPIVTDFKDSARRNGHDPMLAEAMVSVEKVVHFVEDGSGQRRFVDAKEYEALTRDGSWRPVSGLPNPVDGESSLLTVSDDQAVKLGLASGRAASPKALAAERGLNIVATMSSGMGDQIIAVLGNPWVRMILMTIFLQSLFIALHTPGHGAPEAIALFSLGLLVGIPLMTGFAQWWEIALILVGLGLVAFEIFVFPGHLVSLIAGAVMILVGLVLTFVGDAWSVPGSWRMPGTRSSLEHGLYAVTGGLFCSVLLSMWLRRYLPKLPYFSRLILNTPDGGQIAGPLTAGDLPGAGSGSGPVDAWPFVGTVGRAVSDLKPGGSAEFPYADDTRVAAVVSDAGYIRAGTKLVVREVRGARVVVKPV